jgi:YVTN family beta-propeller protein
VVANIGRGQGDSDTVSVIDRQAQPFRVVETVGVGQTPEGIALSPDGKLGAVVVMNGSVDRALVAGHRFSADSRTILVQNMVEKEIYVLRWDGSTLQDTGQRIKTNGGPAAIRTAPRP